MKINIKQSLTPHEENQLTEVLRAPILSHYLEVLAHNIATDIITASPSAGLSDAEFIRKEQFYKGQIAALATLSAACQAACAAVSSTTNHQE